MGRNGRRSFGRFAQTAGLVAMLWGRVGHAEEGTECAATRARLESEYDRQHAMRVEVHSMTARVREDLLTRIADEIDASPSLQKALAELRKPQSADSRRLALEEVTDLVRAIAPGSIFTTCASGENAGRYSDSVLDLRPELLAGPSVRPADLATGFQALVREGAVYCVDGQERVQTGARVRYRTVPLYAVYDRRDSVGVLIPPRVYGTRVPYAQPIYRTVERTSEPDEVDIARIVDRRGGDKIRLRFAHLSKIGPSGSVDFFLPTTVREIRRLARLDPTLAATAELGPKATFVEKRLPPACASAAADASRLVSALAAATAPQPSSPCLD